MDNLDRVIVVRPATHPGEPSYLERICLAAARPVPQPLADWESRVSAWCSEYRATKPDANILETLIDAAVFVFDLAAERVVLAYAVPTRQLQRRDTSRMRGFPDVNVGVQAVMGESAFPADRGHFLGHASGGILDINLFPQRRDLNRGWSSEGRVFRQMERFVAQHPGVFFYHLPRYDEPDWIPVTLEYGVLVEDSNWWVNAFRNK